MQSENKLPTSAAIWTAFSSLGCLVLIPCLLFVAMIGAEFLFTIPFDVAFGWISFLPNKLPQVTLNVSQVGIAIICGMAFTGFAHAAAKWMSVSRQPSDPSRKTWPLKWTLLLASLLFSFFLSGIACIGVAHQSVWLLSFREPWVREMRTIHTMHQIVASELSHQAVTENWTTDELRRHVRRRVAEKDGQFQMYVAEDSNGDWRAIVSRVNGSPYFMSTPRAYKDYFFGEREASLSQIMEFYAQGPRPELKNE